MKFALGRVSCLPLALSLASACSVGSADDGNDGTPVVPDVCRDTGRLGDGICDTDCANPDIDCFTVFADQAAADTWYAGFEELLAQQEFRPPRQLVPATDPRFVKMRDIIDEGWDSYRRNVPVGELSDPPALVMIEDETPNAFVTIDLATGRSAFAVMVHTGLLDLGAPDYELIGVTMHELEHAVGLHVLNGVSDRIRKSYQVLSGPEPFGFQQVNDPVADEALTAWLAYASDAGAYPFPELSGIPLFNTTLAIALNALENAGNANDPAACARSNQARGALFTFLGQNFSSIDFEIDIAGREQELASLSTAYIQALRNECLAAFSLSIYEVFAQLFGGTAQQWEQDFSPADRALVSGRHVVEAIVALGADRYQKMRTVEQMLIATTGGDLTTLRYYSTEEAADDRTVPVLNGTGLRADGIADFFLRLMPADEAQLCSQIVASGQVPPYGNLSDDHHGNCYRMYHVKQLANAGPNVFNALRVKTPGPALVAETAKALREFRESNPGLPVRPPSQVMTDCFPGN